MDLCVTLGSPEALSEPASLSLIHSCSWRCFVSRSIDITFVGSSHRAWDAVAVLLLLNRFFSLKTCKE